MLTVNHLNQSASLDEGVPSIWRAVTLIWRRQVCAPPGLFAQDKLSLNKTISGVQIRYVGGLHSDPMAPPGTVTDDDDDDGV